MQKNLDDKNKVINFVKYKEISCPCCNRILAKVSEDTHGNIIIYCRKCKKSFAVPI